MVLCLYQFLLDRLYLFLSRFSASTLGVDLALGCCYFASELSCDLGQLLRNTVRTFPLVVTFSPLGFQNGAQFSDPSFEVSDPHRSIRDGARILG